MLYVFQKIYKNKHFLKNMQNESETCFFFFFVIVRDCGDLSDPADGSVTVDKTLEGGVATYKCDRGFKLVGNLTRVCEKTGQWSGGEPTCQGECQNSRLSSLVISLFFNQSKMFWLIMMSTYDFFSVCVWPYISKCTHPYCSLHFTKS